MSEIAKRKNIYLGPSELTSRTARMTTASPNTTISEDGLTVQINHLSAASANGPLNLTNIY